MSDVSIVTKMDVHGNPYGEVYVDGRLVVVITHQGVDDFTNRHTTFDPVTVQQMDWEIKQWIKTYLGKSR